MRSRIHLGDLSGLTLPSDYDLVFGLDVFEHLNPNRLAQYLDILHARVVPGGRLFANIPAFGRDEVFGEVFPLYVTDWEHDVTANRPFHVLHCDDDGYPMNGHLIWAHTTWWVEQFQAAGFVREPEAEREIHERFASHFENEPRAARSMSSGRPRCIIGASPQMHYRRYRAERSSRTPIMPVMLSSPPRGSPSSGRMTLTPDDLVEIELIKRLKYRYARCLDLKLWDEIAGCFTDDAVAAYSGGGYSFEGREAIVDFLRRSMGAETFHSSHKMHHPEIDLTGPDTAHGRVGARRRRRDDRLRAHDPGLFVLRRRVREGRTARGASAAPATAACSKRSSRAATSRD